jgi:hypothetical protein
MHSVQDLQIRYLYTEEDGIEELERVFKYLTHLRHLRIEAPCCNDTPWIERRNKPALAWKYGGKIDIARIFELAISTHYARNIEPSVLFQLQSCMFTSRIPEPRLFLNSMPPPLLECYEGYFHIHFLSHEIDIDKILAIPKESSLEIYRYRYRVRSCGFVLTGPWRQRIDELCIRY